MAAYSGTRLARKLDINPDNRVRLINEPDTLLEALLPLPEGALLTNRDGSTVDVQLVFARERTQLIRRLDRAISSMPSEGMIWLAWPKKSSGVSTDLTREIVRVEGLQAGLVDVKVCAIDDVWSGLKFVVRTDDRDGWPRS